jgi:hypothetical protein
MDYSKIYKDFIEDRKTKMIQVDYFEKHHILPRAMGGNDAPENIVKLSAEDHFFAHILLSKIDVRQKHPLVMMMTGARHLKGKLLRRHIGTARRVLGMPLPEATKAKMKATHNKPEAKARVSAQFKGVTLTEDHKEKIKSGMANMSEESRKRMKAGNSMRKKITITEETRKKMSDAQLRRSPEEEIARRKKISKANSGKVRSEEAKKKYSEAKLKSPNTKANAKLARSALPFEAMSKGGKAGGKVTGSLPWWTNGIINTRCVNQPDKTFRQGMTRQKLLGVFQ